jgi:V8-like Glu-specific endopeptidase
MIFGTDDRTLVDHETEDGRLFVQITSTFSNGTVLEGSGVMVGINDVLTAAHTFYSAENGGLASNVIVTPSSFNDYKPYGVAIADHFYLTQEWTQTPNYQYDYGVISLSTPIGYYTGWAGYGFVNDLTATADMEMSSYGYATDIQNGEWLLKTTGKPDKIQGNNILLFDDDLDASGGQSGSAVLTSNSDQSDVVIGLVSHHSYFPEYNAVIALTESSVANIDEWIASNDENLVPLKTTTHSFENVQNISLLYIGLLGRIPDEAGLKYWSEQLAKDSYFYDIIGGFLDSDELKSGTDYTGDNASFINNLYKNILGREADESGFNYWLNDLSVDPAKEKIISGFLESTEYRDTNSLNTYTIWHNWFESFNREVTGTSDSEILKTTIGDDYIDAGAGDDTIDGLAGNDYIYSNIGSDTITGGDGSDFFIFDLTQTGIDTITDFDIYNDKIKLVSDTQNLSIANVDTTDTLVLYQDEDSYIILTGLTKDDYTDIVFV